MINGVINVYKEAGYTSHDVVAKLRGIAGQRKIGHTGTLDPEAVGVLPVCLGSATKLCDMLTDETKEYEACLQLGIITDTQDMSGQVLQRRQAEVTEQAFCEAAQAFVGEYEQVPPMYSAIKVNGKRLYELAREGKSVERKARRVTIYSLDILELHLKGEEQTASIRVVCSRGTYIRTLCQDIGDRLGCGAAMRSLKRTRVGSFCLEEALTLGQLQEKKDAGTLMDAVIKVDALFASLPRVQVKEEWTRLVQNGNSLRLHMLTGAAGFDLTAGSQVRVYDMQERFYGIFMYQGDEKGSRHRQESGQLKPVKMFLEQDE